MHRCGLTREAGWLRPAAPFSSPAATILAVHANGDDINGTITFDRVVTAIAGATARVTVNNGNAITYNSNQTGTVIDVHNNSGHINPPNVWVVTGGADAGLGGQLINAGTGTCT